MTISKHGDIHYGGRRWTMFITFNQHSMFRRFLWRGYWCGELEEW